MKFVYTIIGLNARSGVGLVFGHLGLTSKQHPKIEHITTDGASFRVLGSWHSMNFSQKLAHLVEI